MKYFRARYLSTSATPKYQRGASRADVALVGLCFTGIDLFFPFPLFASYFSFPIFPRLPKALTVSSLLFLSLTL